MRETLICLGIAVLFGAGNLYASSEKDIAQRALTFANSWSTQREEASWESLIMPEYVHPEVNDSGLPSRHPAFLPEIELRRGTFLFTQMEQGRVVSGKTPWILGGKETIYCVEIVYTVVAQTRAQTEPPAPVTLFKEPTKMSQFIAMALDEKDNKWKVVEVYPYGAAFYQIPYFLKAWERILGKGSVQNIPEVSQALLAMVKK